MPVCENMQCSWTASDSACLSTATRAAAHVCKNVSYSFACPKGQEYNASVFEMSKTGCCNSTMNLFTHMLASRQMTAACACIKLSQEWKIQQPWLCFHGMRASRMLQGKLSGACSSNSNSRPCGMHKLAPVTD